MEENNIEKQKEQEKRSKKSASLLLLLILLVTVSIGFALVSKNLEIHGTSKIEKEAWDIGPDDGPDPVPPIECPAGEKCTILDCDTDDCDNPPAPDPGDCNDNSCNGAVIYMKGNIVYFANVFKTPGETFKFTTNIKNNGTIAAKVNTVNLQGFGTNTTAKKYMTYDVKYANKSGSAAVVRQDDVLAAGQLASYEVTVSYNDHEGSLPTDAELEVINGSDGKGAVSLFSVEYVQN